MDDYIIRNINQKYHNNIIKNLPELIIEYLCKNKNYIPLFDNDFITIDEILYFLRNKPYKNRKELLEWILMYIEMRHGIFERAKQFTAKSRNNQK